MKRFWIGVALLLVLFVLGVSITASAGDVHTEALAVDAVEDEALV